MRKTISLVVGLMLICITTARAQYFIDFSGSDWVLSGSYEGITNSHVFYQFQVDSLDKDPILDRAITAYENEDDSVCLAIVEQGLSTAKNPAAYYLLRGASHYRTRQLSLAFADFNKVIGLFPQRAEAYHNMALLYFKEDQMAKAFQFINTALQLGNEHPETVYLLGVFQMDNNEYTNAMEIWKLCLQSDLPASKVYTQIALVHYRREEYDLALEAVEKAMAFEEGLFSPYLIAGTVHQLQKNRGRTIALWQQAIDVLEGKDKQYITWLLAHVLFEEDMYIKGMDYILEAFEIEKFYDDVETKDFKSSGITLSIYELLYAYSQEKANFDIDTRALICKAISGFYTRKSEHYSLLNRVAKRYPNSGFVYMARAALEPFNNFDAVPDRYYEAVQVAPDYWPLIENLVRYFFSDKSKFGDLEKLVPYFEEYIDRIIDRYPDRHVYRLFRAQQHYAQGRVELAIADFTDYINMSGDDEGIAEELRAAAYLSLGDYDKALNDLSTAYSSGIIFQSTKELRNYAALLYQTGDTTKAWEVLKRELGKYPGDAPLLELKGDWHYNNGEYHLSVGAYSSALNDKVYRSGYILQSKLAEVYSKLGLYELSLQIANRVEKGLKEQKYHDDVVYSDMRKACLGKVYYVQSVVYEAMGKEQEALKYAQKAGDLGYVHEERIMPAFE